MYDALMKIKNETKLKTVVIILANFEVLENKDKTINKHKPTIGKLKAQEA